MSVESEEYCENFTPDQVRDSLEAAVVMAYDEARDELEEFEEVPELLTIYEEFQGDTHQTMLEIYQEFFGDGTTPRTDWMYEIGLDPSGLPDLLTIVKILNMFVLPYTLNGVLYNFYTRRLLAKPQEIEEDVMM